MNLTDRYIKSLLTKPFVILTGNSGTGKSKMATLFADWLVGKEGYAFVPVGADWTDNRNVLGYVNMLKTETQTIGTKTVTAPVFQGTEVVKLMVRATENEDAKEKPWFLILDEMNLSHVERYFSDFLAHIESPDKEIRLHHEETSLLFLDDKKGGGKWVELLPEMKPPDNLFVVGTVNVDETTYMFSPKVLDRANVIEFRTSHKALEAAQDKPMLKIPEPPPGLASAADFLNLSQRARVLDTAAPLPDPTTGWGEYKAAILEVFKSLQERGLEFGFRVQKEMLAYARVDYYFNPTAWDWQRCFDEQMMQKVLPKLGGNEKKIGKVLGELSDFCISKLNASEFKEFNEGKSIPEPSERNLSYTKLLHMRRRLAEDRSTRYL